MEHVYIICSLDYALHLLYICSIRKVTISTDKNLLLVTLLALGLNRANHAPARASTAHDVLVSDGKQITLLVRQLDAAFSDQTHKLGHIIVTLGLLAQLGAADVFGFL